MPALDLLCSLFALGVLLCGGIGYAIRFRTAGAAHFARINAVGRSPLLGRGAMEFGYWCMQPLGRACMRAGLTANQLTGVSLCLGLCAGLALATGHLGAGALLASLAAAGDGLDGMLARAAGASTPGGALFDASADRYTEFFLLAGLAFGQRADARMLALALVALLGSFMISYGSAKAEALRVPVPPGAMRRGERAVYLCGGLLLTPLFSTLALRGALPLWTAHLPVLAAVGIVGLVSNVTAALRLRIVARAANAKMPAAAASLHSLAAPLLESPDLADRSAVWVRTPAKRAS